MEHILAILSSEWLVHHVADYSLQNSFLAYHKRCVLHENLTRNLFYLEVCSLHGLLYTSIFVVFYFWNPLNPLTWLDAKQIALIFAAHVLIDYTNAGSLWVRAYNIDFKDWRVEKPIAPFWISVQIDQMLHHITNVAILSLPYWCEWTSLLAAFR